MRLRRVLAGVVLLGLPVVAIAQTQNPSMPKYPPGFDCGSVPAGAERENCQQSQLDPNTDNNGIIDPSNPGNAGGAIQTPGDISPPTVPNEPPGNGLQGNGNNSLTP